jgi:hypothetical protein
MKDEKSSETYIIKGTKKEWLKYLEKIKKAKEKGCASCSYDK